MKNFLDTDFHILWGLYVNLVCVGHCCVLLVQGCGLMYSDGLLFQSICTIMVNTFWNFKLKVCRSNLMAWLSVNLNFAARNVVFIVKCIIIAYFYVCNEKCWLLVCFVFTILILFWPRMLWLEFKFITLICFYNEEQFLLKCSSKWCQFVLWCIWATSILCIQSYNMHDLFQTGFQMHITSFYCGSLTS